MRSKLAYDLYHSNTYNSHMTIHDKSNIINETTIYIPSYAICSVCVCVWKFGKGLNRLDNPART
jgi:hypothetical protein